ncbi:MAG TPA: SAF domain-containing protein [Arachnia sp.]|nr:SAF domain-containing protein [Arachnia sp.]
MKRLLTSVASFVSWHRRAVAALLAALSVVLVAQWLAEPGGPTVSAPVLAVPLAAGHTLTSADVTLADVPAHLVFAGAPPALEDVIGQVTAVDLAAGTLLQAGLLATGQGVAPGRAVVPITLPDRALRSLLRPGDPVTLVVTSAESAEVLTRDARVAALPAPPGGSALAVAGAGDDGLVLMDVPAEEAAVVAALGQSGQLSVVLGAL